MSLSVETPESPRLDYAPGAPLRRRKRVRRVGALIVLLALVFPVYRYSPPVYRRMVLLYEQHRCLAYTAPADAIVYDEASPTTAARATQSGYSMLTVRLWTASVSAAVRQPAELVVFAPNLPPVVAARPSIGVGGRALPRSGAVPTGGVLFLHELRNKSGHRRLVVVQRTPTEVGPFAYPFGLEVALYEPATFRAPARYAGTSPPVTFIDHLSGIIPLIPIRPLRFYAGQVDPADAGHFTIRYELEGQAGVVDGRLNDTGDDLIVRIVSGPATRPSLWTTFAEQQ
jgi:hypothetical protein